MANIFISYHNEARAVAEALSRDCSELGEEPWYDRALSGGQAWWDQILERIRTCDVFVFILSPGGLGSVPCQREWGYAAALGKSVLPVLPAHYADKVPLIRLPPALSAIQYVEWHADDRESALRLGRALKGLPEPGPLPDPLPDPPDVPLSYLTEIAGTLGSADRIGLEAQGEILAQLKAGLKDPEEQSNAESLLSELRGRDDVLASVAGEIDALIKHRRRWLLPAGIAVAVLVAAAAGFAVSSFTPFGDTAQLKSAREELAGLKAELRQSRDSLQQTADKLRTEEARVAGLTKQLADVRKSAADNAAALRSARDEIAGLTTQLTATDDLKQKAEDGLRSAEKEAADLSMLLDARKLEAGQLAAERQAAEAEIARLNKMLADAEYSAAGDAGALDAARAEVTNLADEISGLRKKLDSSNELRQKTRKDLRAAEKKAAGLTKQLAEAVKSADENAAALNSAREEISGLTTQLAASDDLRRKSEDELRAAEKKAAELTSQLEAAELEATHYRNQLILAGNRIAELTKQVNAARPASNFRANRGSEADDWTIFGPPAPEPGRGSDAADLDLSPILGPPAPEQ